jgi:oxygen-independent coproporphyrinogen-3 oxidase
VKHPTAYVQRLAQGSPAHAREVLTDEDRRVERILLELRLRAGLPRDLLHDKGSAAAERFVADGLLDPEDDRLVLTTRGRLLADALVRDLVD